MQACGIEQFSATAKETGNINKVHTKRFSRKTPHVQPKQPHPPNRSSQCRNCGLTWPHKDGPCPAKGQTCNKCGKANHFARVCLSKVIAPRSGGRNQPQLQSRSHVRQVVTQPNYESTLLVILLVLRLSVDQQCHDDRYRSVH